jgi:mono/diheme cytochrome c family protein
MNYKHLLPLLAFCAVIYACSNDDPLLDTSRETEENNNTYSSGTNNQSASDNTVDVSEEKILFDQKCSVCHGNDGTAGIGNAANLQTSKADSTASLQIIINGKGSMPSFKSQLSEQQAHKLIHYVFNLRK